jgi:hypothetical protein
LSIALRNSNGEYWGALVLFARRTAKSAAATLSFGGPIVLQPVMLSIVRTIGTANRKEKTCFWYMATSTWKFSHNIFTLANHAKIRKIVDTLQQFPKAIAVPPISNGARLRRY